MPNPPVPYFHDFRPVSNTTKIEFTANFDPLPPQNIEYSWNTVAVLAADLADEIMTKHQSVIDYTSTVPRIRIFGVPRGGVYAALLLSNAFSRRGVHAEIMPCAETASIIVDDLVDSGKTKQKYQEMYPDKPFFTITERNREHNDAFIVFPWEMELESNGPEDNVRRLLQYIGEDPDREGLRETPSRVLRSYSEIFSGYSKSAADILKVFDNIPADEIIMLDGIDVYSTCEHHLMPFHGKATVAYLPNGDRVVGLSKLARLVDMYARRLQVQERLTSQITEALMEHLAPRGAACYIEAQHFCVCSRGVGKQGSKMKTSSLRGMFREDHAIRQEFFSMIKKG